eukprot:jgi/Orpsp1_1/1178416/evm.model.c7180000065193.1
MINKEKNKFEFNELLYKSALEMKNYDTLNAMYENDYREKAVKLKCIYEIVQESDEVIKIEFLNRIKNNELKIKVDDKFLCYLETEVNDRIVISDLNNNNNNNSSSSDDEEDNIIFENLKHILKKNNAKKLFEYVREKHLLLGNWNILMTALQANVSKNLLNYIIEQKKKIDYSYFIRNNFPYLYYTISTNNFELSEFLIGKGFKYEDPYVCNVLTCLDKDNLMNKKNLNFIFENGFVVDSLTI